MFFFYNGFTFLRERERGALTFFKRKMDCETIRDVVLSKRTMNKLK